MSTSEASLSAIKFGCSHTFSLHKCKNKALKLNNGNYEGLINLAENCISELQLWRKRVDSRDDINHPLPQLTLYSDACPNGWEAASRKHSSGINWSKEESSLHINVLEKAAAYFAVKNYAAILSETSVHLMVDNNATLAKINKQTAPSETVFISERDLGVLC